MRNVHGIFEGRVVPPPVEQRRDNAWVVVSTAS